MFYYSEQIVMFDALVQKNGFELKGDKLSSSCDLRIRNWVAFQASTRQ